MNPRERVITALSHEQPDRCPMQISFTPEFANRLGQSIGSEITAVHNPPGGGNTYQLERFLEQDMLLTSVGWANSYYQTLEPGVEYIDEWGIGWRAASYKTKFGDGVYTEIVNHPLADDAAVEVYHAPDPNRKSLYLDAEKTIQIFKSEYWIVGVTVTTVWETAWALRGLEKMLIDLAMNPDLAERILDIPWRYHLAAAKKLTQLGVDMIWIGDDVGAQEAMIISPLMWRHFFKPKMAEFITQVKAVNPAVKIAYHSDGNIIPIIPDLIEIGLDVINPIQPACMNPADLKKQFGDNLCFWGTIDEQHTLPFGSPGDIAKEVVDRLKTVGKSGGLILGPTHHVQLDTPLENFWAMVNTIKTK
jgi:uroporphyrinogen decarboxylase